MSRWKAPAAGICFCFLVVVALLTILFVVMNKHPERKVDAYSTDTRVLDSVSTVWCGWQEVGSSHPITVYRVTGEPTYQRSPTTNFKLNYDMKLHWGRERQLKYYLLSGSSVDIKACSNRPGIFLRVFQGIQKWKDCQRLRNVRPFLHDNDDSSSSEESSEIRSGRHSLKEFIEKKLGENTHGWYPPDCKEAFQSREIPSKKEQCQRSIFSLRIGDPDVYVFSVEDYHSAADESGTKIKIFLNRTIYDTSSALVVCRGVTLCDVPLSFGADERSVFTVGTETDVGAVTYTVVAKCKPRVFFFIFLFAFIPLLLLLCIGCIVLCCRRREKKKTAVRYIEVKRTEEPVTPKHPLLSGPEVTLYSRGDRYHRPPAYPNSSAPPPYSPPSPTKI